ncbi:MULTISPECIES: IucA/IucC family C-terminal-domain containing protein [Streptosporangium]|uniref:Ferric iron reductase protein FhuF n=1 Tax=Streptosporangium brasiliense TaxID=47480 RepID=A0ABT9RN26_9ACTN|nr:IucA/IucC family C-terminal-domain containing protein [Streptosporangium brasiliense]MDP9869720.1 ferric iron reductase protein FhuF [Streptosporangium brasiliense]
MTHPSADPTAVLETLAGHGERYRLEAGLNPEEDWIAADRLLDPTSTELTQVLEAERVGSGQVSAHAVALTVMAVYAGTVTAPALLAWALYGVVLDVRPENVALRLGDHGFKAVALRRPRLVDVSGMTGDERLGLLVKQVLDDHLFPLADAMRVCSRAGRRQLHGGIAQGCAAAFSAASRSSGAEVDVLQRAYDEFLAACPQELGRLGEMIRLAEGGREGLFYLRRTCCLFYTADHGEKCASCCLDSVEDRVTNYRRILAGGAIPH